MLKMLLFIVVYMSSIIHLSVQNEIDDKWIDSMIQKKFAINNDEVLSYKIALVITHQPHRSKRELRPVEIQIENQIIHLNLYSVEYNVIPCNVSIWVIKPDSKAELGHFYQKITNNDCNLYGTLYEDPEKNAMMYAYYEDGHRYYYGVIKEKNGRKVIRPLLEKLRPMPTPNFNPNLHIVFNTREKNSTTMEQPRSTVYYDNAPKLAKPLEILNVKLLLLIESNYFNAIGKSIADVMKYLSLFWTLVNAMYNEFTNPKVNIIITGVIILPDDPLDFVQKSFYQTDAKYVNSRIILQDGKEYIQNVFTNKTDFTNFDSAVFMTNFTDGILTGLGSISQICENAVIFTSDNAMFGGVEIAAHELGHSLGLHHDDLTSVNGPFNSTIMAPMKVTVGNFYWSQKSQEELKALARTKNVECLEHTYRK